VREISGSWQIKPESLSFLYQQWGVVDWEAFSSLRTWNLIEKMRDRDLSRGIGWLPSLCPALFFWTGLAFPPMNQSLEPPMP